MKKPIEDIISGSKQVLERAKSSEDYQNARANLNLAQEISTEILDDFVDVTKQDLKKIQESAKHYATQAWNNVKSGVNFFKKIKVKTSQTYKNLNAIDDMVIVLAEDLYQNLSPKVRDFLDSKAGQRLKKGLKIGAGICFAASPAILSAERNSKMDYGSLVSKTNLSNHPHGIIELNAAEYLGKGFLVNYLINSGVNPKFIDDVLSDSFKYTKENANQLNLANEKLAEYAASASKDLSPVISKLISKNLAEKIYSKGSVEEATKKKLKFIEALCNGTYGLIKPSKKFSPKLMDKEKAIEKIENKYVEDLMDTPLFLFNEKGEAMYLDIRNLKNKDQNGYQMLQAIFQKWNNKVDVNGNLIPITPEQNKQDVWDLALNLDGTNADLDTLTTAVQEYMIAQNKIVSGLLNQNNGLQNSYSDLNEEHNLLATTVNDTIRNEVETNTQDLEKVKEDLTFFQNIFTEGKYNLFVGPRVYSIDLGDNGKNDLVDGYVFGIRSGGPNTGFRLYFASGSGKGDKSIKEITNITMPSNSNSPATMYVDDYNKEIVKEENGRVGVELEQRIGGPLHVGVGLELMPNTIYDRGLGGVHMELNEDGQVIESSNIAPENEFSEKQKTFYGLPIKLALKGKHFQVDLKYGLITEDLELNNLNKTTIDDSYLNIDATVPINLEFLSGGHN